jgi:predicted transcriptional regulator of viral defense system
MIIMKTNEFVKRLNLLQLGAFTDADAYKILQKDKKYCNLYLHRATDRGDIIRVERGIYALNGSGRLEIAGALVANSYVTAMAALFYHGLIDQDPAYIELASTRIRKHKIVDTGNGQIEVYVRKLPKAAFFGYYKTLDNIGMFFVAEPEKALIDMLLLHGKGLESYAKDIISEHKIDAAKLIEYSKRIESKAVSRRIEILVKKGIESKQGGVQPID